MITPEQYHAMLARLDRNNLRDPKQLFDQAGQPPTVASESAHREKSAGRPDPVLRESVLHDSIMELCRSRGWVALHGSMAHRTHRSIGEPDFVIVADGGRVFFLEAKRKGSKPTPEQLAMLAWLVRLGAAAHVVYSIEEVLNLVDPCPGQL